VTPVYNMVLAGRGKKNAKSLDLVLAGLYCIVIRRSALGNAGFIVASDEDQAGDDLALAKKLVNCNPDLLAELEVLHKELRLRDSSGSLRILPGRDIAGSHGKTGSFIGFDEIHTMKDWDLFEALQPDPTRVDALTWVTSYDTIYNIPGVPLVDLKAIARAGSDPRMLFSRYSGEYCSDPKFAELEPELRANPSIKSWPEGAKYLEQQRTRLPSGRFRRLHLNLPGSPEGAAFDQAAILRCVVTGRRSLPPEPGRRYQAAVDMSGGSSDDATLCVWHVDGRTKVIDLVAKQIGEPTFDPRNAVAHFCRLLRGYNVHAVWGDTYGGNTFRADFKNFGVDYSVITQSASDFYEAFEPVLNAGEVELLDQPVLIEQLVSLVWRGNKITHEHGAHDDHANAVALAVFVSTNRKPAMVIPPGLAARLRAMPNVRDGNGGRMKVFF
jgi:hypothetical protein